jgi:hypothetical protein
MFLPSLSTKKYHEQRFTTEDVAPTNVCNDFLNIRFQYLVHVIEKNISCQGQGTKPLMFLAHIFCIVPQV